MKIGPHLFILGLLAISTRDGEAQTYYVEEIDQATQTSYQIAVTPEGTSLNAQEPLGAQGDMFQLWYNPGGALPTELAEAATSPVNLSVSMSVQSSDVVNSSRTRVDKPYQLSYSVSGLLVGAGDPGDQQVTLSRETLNNIQNEGPWTLMSGPFSLTNGAATVAELPAVDYGIENWYITRPATSYSTAYRFLDTVPPMEVFPLASCSLSGVPVAYSGSVSGFPSAITLTCTNLYPSNRLVFLLVPPTGTPVVLYDNTTAASDSVNYTGTFDIRPDLSLSGTYALQIWQKVPVDLPSNPSPAISNPVPPGANWGWEELTGPTTFTTNFSMNITANIVTP